MDTSKATGKPAEEAVEELAKVVEGLNKTANVAAVGACLYVPPGSVQPKCFQLSPEQCRAIGGTYVGGPCK